MKKVKDMKKICTLVLIGIFIGSGIQVGGLQNNLDETIDSQTITYQLHNPTVQEAEDYVLLSFDQQSSTLLQVGNPEIPVITSIFTIPYGSTIQQLHVDFSNKQSLFLTKEIKPVQLPQEIGKEIPQSNELIKNHQIYESNTSYPSSQYTYQVHAGLKQNEHVYYVTVHTFLLQYLPSENLVFYYDTINISLTYQKPAQPITFPDTYDLVIIATDEYSQPIQPLIDHKQQHSIKTWFKTTEEIYAEYNGRDEAEQIKYFIKDAVENYGASYVLLIGSIYKLPIRTSAVRLWGRWQEDTLTDLYYADIFNANQQFSSWDSNENNIFGETEEDTIDLYPDVHIGRLACDTVTEVETVVDKIIHYEDYTYGEDWYYNMIYIGGNTFQWSPGNEGEEINEMVMDIMTDFTPSLVIWTSKRNFNRKSISGAINQGAGFLDYSGHGFEHGMGTYPPHGLYLRTYLTPYIEDLLNGYKLPIMFFDACLTAKLDFVLQDVLNYKQYRIFDVLAKIMNYDTNIPLPCYAWYFIKHKDGGAIATIGATRTAFGGTNSGAGKLSLEFFSSYEKSETIGQMITEMQNGYISDVPDDEFTVEEFILLGDPSLILGGYP